MLSNFELLASLIKQDRFFMEVDEHGFGDLLINILRTCHDMNHQKYDSTWLADAIVDLITPWAVEGAIVWPEMEGSGPTSWDEVDAAENPSANPSENPSTDGAPDTETGVVTLDIEEA